jgi:hypothetical protein
MKEQQTAAAQQVLDELLSERLIPFALIAYGVNPNGGGEYVVPFRDSRIHSCSFLWKQGEDFKQVVRAAVLERVNRMDGPLHMKTARPH